MSRTDRLLPITGTPPSLIQVPPGCPFHPRCRAAGVVGPRCRTERPPFRMAEPDHYLACHLGGADRDRIWEEEVQPTL